MDRNEPEIVAADNLMDRAVDLAILVWSPDFSSEEKRLGIGPLLHDLAAAIRAYRNSRGMEPAEIRLVKREADDARD